MNLRSTFTTVGFLLLLSSLCNVGTAQAQMEIQPFAGVQTMIFHGRYPANDPISPSEDQLLPFGGGLRGANNAIRLGAEIIPNRDEVLRIPIVVELYEFEGKTTFAVPGQSDRRVQQLRLRYSANMLSFGGGLTASFFRGTTLYGSAEGRVNYIFPTLLTSELYYLDTGELIVPQRSIRPSPDGQFRIGLVLRLGTQLDFFDPVLIDVNIGYGAVNLLGKNTDPNSQRNILTAEPTLTSPEVTLAFATFGLGLVWSF